ncbi:MAG: hypothetical protein H6622_14840 [Halobacteriovoraceae bacterium]|nr:hypothetical protein [Halobacteriovoraceae bacterium]
MKLLKIIGLLVILFLNNVYCQENADLLRQNKISDPSISANCRELLKQRNDRLTFKQRLLALRLRAENLIKKAPPNRKSVITKLKINRDAVIREASLMQIKIANLEEKIIRKGCPGITLEPKKELIK